MSLEERIKRTYHYLTPLEMRILNNGERLIPGRTHDIDEFRRHISSYVFWRRIIENDIANGLVSPPIRIVDLGCGVGYGCGLIAKIPGTQVLGVDIDSDALLYAQQQYGAENITFEKHDLTVFMKEMPDFDYAMSRAVLEHIPDGLNLALNVKYTKRLLIDVPYKELEVNPHHQLHQITEKDFTSFSNAVLLFQDMEGTLYTNKNIKPNITLEWADEIANKVNVIMCIQSTPDMTELKDMEFNFPLVCWEPTDDDPMVKAYESLPKPPSPIPPKPTFSSKVKGKIRKILSDLRR